MTKEEVANIWRNSDLPERIQGRIIGEIDNIMYNTTPEDVDWEEKETRKILMTLRYLALISPRQHNELLMLLEDNVATRLHQLENTEDHE